MVQPALAAFDPDLSAPRRKPQFASQFDPRWAVNFYFGCGSGPYATAPYASRGIVDKMVPIGASGGGILSLYRDGWSVNTSAGTTDGYGYAAALAAATTWWPGATGTLIVTFRSNFAPNDGGNHLVFAYGNTAAGPVLEFNKFTDNKLYAGWFNVTEGRVATAASGTWTSGDLVTLGVDWDNSGAISYINGAQQGTKASTNLPVNLTGTANNGLMVGNGTKSETGRTDGVLCVTLLDRRLSADEHAWIAANPLNWPFLPGPITATMVMLPSPPPPQHKSIGINFHREFQYEAGWKSTARRFSTPESVLAPVALPAKRRTRFPEPDYQPILRRRIADVSQVQPATPGGYRPRPQAQGLRAPPWHPRAQRRSFDVSTAQPPSGPAPLPRHPVAAPPWQPPKRRPAIDPGGAQPFIGPYPPPRRRFAETVWHPPLRKRLLASTAISPGAGTRTQLFIIT